MADDNHADEPKKTETVEIRLAPELKEALRQTAEAEGRSISVVLRGLIDGYLAQARRPRSTLKEIVMFFRHPIRLLAVAVGSLAVALFGITGSTAQDLTLEIQLEVWSPAPLPDQPGGAVTRASRSMQTTLSANYGETSSLRVGEGTPRTTEIEIVPEAVDAETYRLRVSLRETGDAEATVLAEPVIIARFGEPARVQVENGDASGYMFMVLGERPA
jgi:hypothetical protein